LKNLLGLTVYFMNFVKNRHNVHTLLVFTFKIITIMPISKLSQKCNKIKQDLNNYLQRISNSVGSAGKGSLVGLQRHFTSLKTKFLWQNVVRQNSRQKIRSFAPLAVMSSTLGVLWGTGISLAVWFMHVVTSCMHWSYTFQLIRQNVVRQYS
jgi:hypothetical protein